MSGADTTGAMPGDPGSISDGGTTGAGPGDPSTISNGGSGTDESGDTGQAPPPGPEPGAFLDGFFPIGVFAVPPYDMQGWANLGCNTMLSVPGGSTVAEWDLQAQSLGLAVIRKPLGDGTADLGRTDLLAWLLPDEPDVEGNNVPCGGNCVDLVEARHAQWKALDPSRKIFVNLSGPNILLSASCDYCNGPGDQPPVEYCYPDNDQCYPRLIDSTDWVSQDIYPVSGWLPYETLREDVTVVGQALDRLRDWTDKPLFAIIEVSDQRLGFPGTGTRGPTPDEYRAQLWHAIIHGARGVFYFPEAFNPFEFDNTEPAVKAEMVVQHDLLAELGPLLQTAIDPGSVTVAPDAPLEATWRVTASEAWVFVLNTSGSAVTGHLQLGGITGDASVFAEARTVTLVSDALIDEFAPYEVHVYQLSRN
ncbi:hypothetical protein [Paraliomyxa miuraensis]|uniref:hypothetical protein n=1 Tax=Paraliomyxa miuraensis TaxID=376150 RepID=UPI00224E0D5A|nr:hypothetical protein [Paraliomyxa miuraensis]MCX4241885.1 hypothetical protein [Paraliomyxa miuraensis]